MLFFGNEDQDQEVIIKPYFKYSKVSLKIVYFLVKSFSAGKLGIVVSILQNTNILRSKGPSMKPCLNCFPYTKTVSDLTSVFCLLGNFLWIQSIYYRNHMPQIELLTGSVESSKFMGKVQSLKGMSKVSKSLDKFILDKYSRVE